MHRSQVEVGAERPPGQRDRPPPARPAGSRRWARLEAGLVVAIAAHSAVVGALLLLPNGLGLRLAGWNSIPAPFFTHQGGVFHLVVAAGYLTEYFRHRGVTLLLIAKCAAFVFLVPVSLTDATPWAVPVSGALDGLMAMVVFLVHRRVTAGRGDARRAVTVAAASRDVGEGEPEECRDQP